VDRLIGERMVGDLAFADQILGAGDLIREDRRDQVFRLHAQELGGDFLAAAKAGERERERRPPHATRVVNIGESSIAWTSTSRTLFEWR